MQKITKSGSLITWKIGMAASGGGKGDDNWGRGLSYGMEIGIGVAVGGFGGHWLDRHFGWTPWGLIVGLLIGCFAGMYLLIKDAIKMNRD